MFETEVEVEMTVEIEVDWSSEDWWWVPVASCPERASAECCDGQWSPAGYMMPRGDGS